ncbi:MAG: hypothetical protein FWC68_05420, partial [Oscillospiraceae bacterium]|nr:hypothetical protein [Oscillospiraceae bacterium]
MQKRAVFEGIEVKLDEYSKMSISRFERGKSHMKAVNNAVDFITSNFLYLIWFAIYFTIAWIIFGATLNAFFIVLVIYGISITIALSPIGEVILRLMEGCREPTTEEERNYLMPLFEEVYENAKESNPKLNSDIRIYIM